MNEVLYILFGWSLGLLNPRIVDRIQQYYKRGEVRRAILTDLENLQVKVAMCALLIARRSGRVDRSLIQWCVSIMRGYKGFYATLLPPGMLDQLEHLTDEQIAQLRTSPDTGLTLKKYGLPFVDVNLERLAIFRVEIQRSVNEIREELSSLNQEIDYAWYYHQRTFESLAGRNPEIVRANAERSYDTVGRMCRDLADHIAELRREWK